MVAKSVLLMIKLHFLCVSSPELKNSTILGFLKLQGGSRLGTNVDKSNNNNNTNNNNSNSDRKGAAAIGSGFATIAGRLSTIDE